MTKKNYINNVNINQSGFIRRTCRNIRGMYELTMLSYIQNTGAVFFTLFFPILLLGILGAVFTATIQSEHARGIINSTIAGVSIAAITGNGLNGLSVRLSQWKQSTIIKRIGSTPLKKWEFLASVIIFYINIMMFQTLWITTWAFIFFHSQIGLSGDIALSGSSYVIQLHPLFILISMFLTMIFAVSFGVIISTISRDVNTISSLAIMVFLPAAFLSGQYIPISTIDQSQVLSFISKIWPQRYLVEYLYHGWGAVQVVSINGIQTAVDAVKWDSNAIILGAVYPLVVSILAILFSIKVFKWE